MRAKSKKFKEWSGGLFEVLNVFFSSVLGSVYWGLGGLKVQKSLFEPCIGEKGEIGAQKEIRGHFGSLLNQAFPGPPLAGGY